MTHRQRKMRKLRQRPSHAFRIAQRAWVSVGYMANRPKHFPMIVESRIGCISDFRFISSSQLQDPKNWNTEANSGQA